MIFRTIFGGLVFLGVGAKILTPIVRKIYGYEDKTTKEYHDRKAKEFLDTVDQRATKKIENSNGENWF